MVNESKINDHDTDIFVDCFARFRQAKAPKL